MKYNTEDPKWVHFYPNFNSSMYVEKAGYFDERPEVHTSVTQLIALLAMIVLLFYSTYALLLLPLVFFGWGTLFIHLPFKTGLQDCESPAWGFDYHHNKIWIYIGGSDNYGGGAEYKTITMPWDYTWVRTSTLCIPYAGQECWIDETKAQRAKWEQDALISWDKYIDISKWKETYEYTDKRNGTRVNATVCVVEREWRPIGLQFTKLFAKTSKAIEVEFSDEVGRGKGSWKGGAIGCSYVMKPNETPLECLRRMEKERDL